MESVFLAVRGVRVQRDLVVCSISDNEPTVALLRYWFLKNASASESRDCVGLDEAQKLVAVVGALLLGHQDSHQ